MMLRELKAPDKLVYATMPWEEHMRVKTDIVSIGGFCLEFLLREADYGVYALMWRI